MLACLMEFAVTTHFCCFLWHLPIHVFIGNHLCAVHIVLEFVGTFKICFRPLFATDTPYPFLQVRFFTWFARKTGDLLVCFIDSSEGKNILDIFFSPIFFIPPASHHLPVNLEMSRIKNFFSRISSEVQLTCLLVSSSLSLARETSEPQKRIL